ncbi:hypothetical protein [uncultured Shimia sp.]|nr:hypothetical protein [uncultured Shimia sp.]
MDFLIVIGAGLASYLFGAIWYMSLASRWMEAAGPAQYRVWESACSS